MLDVGERLLRISDLDSQASKLMIPQTNQARILTQGTNGQGQILLLSSLENALMLGTGKEEMMRRAARRHLDAVFKVTTDSPGGYASPRFEVLTNTYTHIAVTQPNLRHSAPGLRLGPFAVFTRLVLPWFYCPNLVRAFSFGQKHKQSKPTVCLTTIAVD